MILALFVPTKARNFRLLRQMAAARPDFRSFFANPAGGQRQLVRRHLQISHFQARIAMTGRVEDMACAVSHPELT